MIGAMCTVNAIFRRNHYGQNVLLIIIFFIVLIDVCFSDLGINYFYLTILLSVSYMNNFPFQYGDASVHPVSMLLSPLYMCMKY